MVARDDGDTELTAWQAMDEPTWPQDRPVEPHLLKLPAIEVLHLEDEIPSTVVLLGSGAAFVEIAHVTDSVGGHLE